MYALQIKCFHQDRRSKQKVHVRLLGGIWRLLVPCRDSPHTPLSNATTNRSSATHACTWLTSIAKATMSAGAAIMIMVLDGCGIYLTLSVSYIRDEVREDERSIYGLYQFSSLDLWCQRVMYVGINSSMNWIFHGEVLVMWEPSYHS